MPEYQWVTPNEWYQSLDDETRRIADQKIQILMKFNAADPLAAVSSEMRENIPAVATFLFLHHVRSQVLNGYSQFSVLENIEFEKSLSPLQRMKIGAEAFNRLVEAGVNRADLVRVARAAACRATFNFLEMLDGDYASYKEEGLNDAPDYALIEIVEEDGERKLTGRRLVGLHESIADLYSEDQ